MRGNLDDPPIVITASYWKTSRHLVMSSVFVLAGAGIVYREESAWIVGIGWMSVGFFGLVTLLMLARLLAPPTLTLAPDGVSWFNGFKTYQFGWRDIHNFRVFRIWLSKMVGFEMRPDFPKQAGLRRFNRGVFGIDAAFEPGWSISDASLADLLNVARRRWLAE